MSLFMEQQQKFLLFIILQQIFWLHGPVSPEEEDVFWFGHWLIRRYQVQEVAAGGSQEKGDVGCALVLSCSC